MKRSIKKTMIWIMACVMLFSIAALTGCDDEAQPELEDVTETTLEDNQEEEDTTLPSESVDLSQYYEPAVFERLNKTYMIDGFTVLPAEYNFYFVNAYTEYSTYAYYGYYPATYSGLLDLEALCEFMDEEGATWGDFIEMQVEREIRKVYMMYDLAKDAGLYMTEDKLESIESTVELISADAQANNTDSNAYLAQYYGEGMTVELFRQIMERNFLSNAYYEYFLEEYEFSEEEIMLPTVRHILFPVAMDAPEEEINEALEWAETVLEEVSEYNDMIIIGDRELTAERSLESAEYIVSMGQMVQEFEEWCFDPSREEGDKGIIQTRFGFHVVYFVGRTEANQDQKNKVAEAVLSDILDELSETERFTLIPA